MKENITKQNNGKLRINEGEGDGEEREEEERGNKNIWKFDCDENDNENQNEDENERGRGSEYVNRSDSMRRQSNRGYQGGGNVGGKGNVVGGVGGDGMMSVSLNERYVMSFCMIQSIQSL